MTAIEVPVSSHRAVDVPESLLALPVWSEADLHGADVPVVDSQFVSIGGGLASFALVDLLRVAGVESDRIRVLGPTEWPHDTYRYLCESSGLTAQDRLHTDAPFDDLWWRMFAEPLLGGRFRPTSGEVNAGIRRMAERIDWPSLRAPGSVRALRRRLGGGYFALLESPEGPIAYRSEFAHVAVGHPGLQFLPELRRFRAKYGDNHRFVHVYEPHQHLYRALLERPGTVLVRGTDHAALRVLRRLVDDRDRLGAQTRIVHLFGRNSRMPGSRWLDRGRREGWYLVMEGALAEVAPDVDGRLLARGHDPAGGRLKLGADFIVDATGLDGEIGGHGLVADLVERGGASRTASGGLAVSPSLEVLGTDNGSGRCYASGVVAGAGSFRALRSAALTIRADLARQDFCDRIGPVRSVARRLGRTSL